MMLPPVLPKCISNKAGKACNNHGLVNHTQTNPETQREGIAGVGVANRCLNMRCSPCVANALCTCIGIALATDNVVGNVTDGDSTKNHLGLACCEPSRLGGVPGSILHNRCPTSGDSGRGETPLASVMGPLPPGTHRLQWM